MNKNIWEFQVAEMLAPLVGVWQSYRDSGEFNVALKKIVKDTLVYVNPDQVKYLQLEILKL